MAEIPEKVKKTASEAKVKASELAGKAGEKMPDKVKETYGKLSGKAKDLIPGGDAEESTADDAGDAATDEESTAGDG